MRFYLVDHQLRLRRVVERVERLFLLPLGPRVEEGILVYNEQNVTHVLIP
jgi:hypothetical protein